MKKSTYVDYVINDVLSRLEGVSARAMFGWYGLYLNVTIFGLIADEALYFKADESSRGEYKVLGSEPFGYQTKKGKRVAMSYWEVPAQVSDDPELVAEWARMATRVTKVNARRLAGKAK